MKIFSKEMLWFRLIGYGLVIVILFYVFNTYLWDVPWLSGASSNNVEMTIETATSSLTKPDTLNRNAIGLPVRLIIPSLSINANIQSVGISFKGNMSVPSNYTDVGWYKYGPKPGERGNAVIDGHVSNGFGLRAVFSDLKILKIGDHIYVVDNFGATTTFVVESSAMYDYNKAPIADIFGSTDKNNLNLITCAGTWIESLKMNDERLVIYTREVI
jgi:LPXTG-site transpeptidase (sortase) family protein